MAVSLSNANHHASLPVSYRLYLPRDWRDYSKRRRKTGMPEDVGFKTKPEIALEQVAAACRADRNFCDAAKISRTRACHLGCISLWLVGQAGTEPRPNHLDLAACC